MFVIDEIDLQPGSLIKLEPENHWFAAERIERDRVWLDVAHTSHAGVGIGVLLSGAVKAVIAAPRFYKAAAVDFPASIAIGAVIKNDLVCRRVIFDAGMALGETRKRRRYFMVWETEQNQSLKRVPEPVNVFRVFPLMVLL